MKKMLTFALLGAAIAGVVYLLKDNETVKAWVGEAKDAASDGFTKATDGYSEIRDRSSNALSEIV